MKQQLSALVRSNLRMILRDRILQAVIGVAIVMLFMVPSLSSFSSRSVQELAITISLSTISLVLLVVSLLLGSSAVWRDFERRYTSAVLTLPISRATYLLAKFISISIFIFCCGLILAAAAAVVIPIAAAQYKSSLPIAWGNIFVAIFTDMLKYMLLSSIAIALSALSTSFFLPFFGSYAIYLAGSASQEVYEYISGEFGNSVSAVFIVAIKAVYYLLPNFAAYNFKVHAVYALALPVNGILMIVGYTITYVAIALGTGVWLLNRREFP
jgi:ABC-type transport system involved in multi-copper enzyme maturation permease subunit